MITSEVIADSISPLGKRITSLKLRYPKFIHGEFMTHRVFSRNASSSRAIPVRKLIQEVRDDNLRASPVWWGREQKGMASGDELDNKDWYTTIAGVSYSTRGAAKHEWKFAALNAANTAERMVKMGLHKSIVNRILEPFSHINVVVTATEYDNFFGLRLDKDAQPEIRVLAETMWRAMGESKPRKLNYGEWHLPFADDAETWDELETANVPEDQIESALIKISVARCARTSYESFETKKRSSFGEDITLFERLKVQAHWSPFEHPATSDTPRSESPDLDGWWHSNEWGNFKEWRQFRKMMDGEAVKPLPLEYRQ